MPLWVMFVNERETIEHLFQVIFFSGRKLWAAYDRVKRKTSVAEKYCNHQVLGLCKPDSIHVFLKMVIYCDYGVKHR